MKTLSCCLLSCFFLLTLSSCVEKGLDTKLIASKYKKSVVKVITIDPTQYEAKPGTGFLGRGSGFIVTDDGYVFTNRHVIETCVKGFISYAVKEEKKNVPKFSVYSDAILENRNMVKAYRTGHAIPLIQVFNGEDENDYTLYKAEVVSVGTGSFDGALLKIVSDMDGKRIRAKFNPVPLGNSDNVTQGESLCVYGYPAQIKSGNDIMLKDMSTLSVGIMSGLDYNFNKEYGYLKTDAEIHPGNSGGPVFNEENKVIGIATARGLETGIGLVGGLNAMFYVSAIDNKAHQKLVENGLTFPKRSPSINSEKAVKYPIKTVKTINDVLDRRNNPYAQTKLFVSNISYKSNGNKLPSQYKKFQVNDTYNHLYVVVNNGLKYLRITKLTADIYQNSNGKYVYKSSVNKTISKFGGSRIVDVGIKINRPGSYKIVARDQANKKIGEYFFTTTLKE